MICRICNAIPFLKINFQNMYGVYTIFICMYIIDILHYVNINKWMLFISRENYIFGLFNAICSPTYFPILFLKALDFIPISYCMISFQTNTKIYKMPDSYYYKYKRSPMKHS